jgi:hypothetical protein
MVRNQSTKISLHKSEFWVETGKMNKGLTIPEPKFLINCLCESRLHLKCAFSDGSEQPYWNTFLSATTYNTIDKADCEMLRVLLRSKFVIAKKINNAIGNNQDCATINLKI